jgi:hypothetical protein
MSGPPGLDQVAHRFQQTIRDFLRIYDEMTFADCLLDFFDSRGVEYFAIGEVFLDTPQLRT